MNIMAIISARRRMVLTGLLAATVLVPTASGIGQVGANPSVFPPNSSPYGISHGRWSAKWWQWAYSLPVDANPLTDTAPVGTGQTGDVWFLGGSFAPTTDPDTGQTTAIETRTVTIPQGKALFFPVANAEASTIEGNGVTYRELGAAAVGFQNAFANMSCEIDGRTVGDLQNYRVESPLYVFGPLPDDNILESFGETAPAGATSQSVSDGVYLMVAPLPVGAHTIHFHAEVPDFNFLLDITYNITIASRE